MIEVVTLGNATVLRDRVPLPIPPTSRDFLILVRLCLCGPTEPPALYDLFWPDDAPEDRGLLLEAALDRLREQIGADAFRADGRSIDVDSGRVTVDVDRFREAVSGDRPRDALGLYRGPFLEDQDFPGLPDFDDWVKETRRTLASLARRARDRVPWDDDSAPQLWPRVVHGIRSRRVVHVAILYLGFAWGSLEVCSTLVQMEIIANGLFVALLAFHVMSFPLVIAAAWLLEGSRPGDAIPLLPDALGRVGFRAVHLLALLGVLTAGSVVGWVVLQWGSEGSVVPLLRAELPEEKHLAVLPFHVLGDVGLARDLGDGLMETLTSQLTGVEGLKGTVSVVSSADVRAREIRSPADARNVFGVNLAVTGSVASTRDSVRVMVNLVDAVRGRQFNSFVLSESAAELARLQQGILDGLRGILELDLEPADEEILASGRTASPQAYGLQVRARGFLQRFEREENLDRALELFREALEHDPTYVLALAGIGEVHKRKFDLSRDPAELERGRAAVLSALELDDGIAQVQVTLGLILSGTGRHEDAADAFQRALEREPHSVDALLGLGDARRQLGHAAEAESAYLRAQNVRSGDWRIHNGLGVLYFGVGRYEEAVGQFERVVELTPDNDRGWANLGALHFMLGQGERAVEYFERSIAIAPNDQALSNLASYYFYERMDYARAAELYEEALALNERDYLVWHNLASAYSFIPGEEERARVAYRSTLERARAAQELNPRDPAVLMALAASHAHLGEPDRARILLRQALDLAPREVGVLFQAGSIHETLGDREEAIRLIRAAMDRGYSRELVERAPGLAALRADPGFRSQVPEE